MNKTGAFKALLDGQNVTLACRYWEREERHLFEAEYFGKKERKAYFDHSIQCIKNDFRDISTFYGGNKADCTFTWSINNE